MGFSARVGVAVAAAVVLAAGGLVVTSPATAAEQARIYDNCTKYNNKFPHGVGKRHAHDQTSGTPVTNFKRSNTKYRRAMRHNSDLDRDGDKIVCEKA